MALYPSPHLKAAVENGTINPVDPRDPTVDYKCHGFVLSLSYLFPISISF